MEYITSRGFDLPNDQIEMESFDWFNMWKNKNFPYTELLVGDTLYWFDTKAQRLVWKTVVEQVDRYPYADKNVIFQTFENSLGKEYFDSRPDSGYFLGYKIKVLDKISIPKPANFNFPRLGWLRVENKISINWFQRGEIDDTNTLDDNISLPNSSIADQLAELNSKMQNVLPERINKLVSTTIRKDTKIIKLLKTFADFKCQLPDCEAQIKMKKGGYYIEVAHIKAVSQNGQSVLGNLIVLCPNHHKEFDYGELHISAQSIEKLSGFLNGKQFEISLIK